MNSILNFKVTSDELDLQSLIKKDKAKLLKDFEANYSVQEQSLSIFTQSVDYCTMNGYDSDKLIWNAAGAINIISLDLKHLVADMMLTENEWKKRLHGRTVSMLIYESLNDVFEILGKDFKAIIQNLPNFPSINKDLTSIKKQLNDFKDKYFEILKRIRNVVIAHRDRDIQLQIQTITNMGWLTVFNCAQEFDKILNALGPILQKIINSSLDNPNR